MMIDAHVHPRKATKTICLTGVERSAGANTLEQRLFLGDPLNNSAVDVVALGAPPLACKHKP